MIYDSGSVEAASAEAASLWDTQQVTVPEVHVKDSMGFSTGNGVYDM